MPKEVTLEEYRRTCKELANKLSAVLSDYDTAYCAEVLLNLWVGTWRAMGFTEDVLHGHLAEAWEAKIATIEARRVS